MFNCEHCGNAVPLNMAECPHCAHSVGWPNVRAAMQAQEVKALEKRLAGAYTSAKARHADEALDRFRNAVGNSCAVIARPLAVVQQLLTSENAIYTTYHQQVAEGARIPENNKFDQRREAIDATMFPGYYKHIRFACLTLEARGAEGYGDYVLVLNTQLIAHRTSVFEENPFEFFPRHGMAYDVEIPVGYRAVWEKRGDLASVKLVGKISSDTNDDEFPSILLSVDGASGKIDFVEAHIYGHISAKTVESVAAGNPRTREDRVIWKSVKKKLEKIGVKVTG